jgi:hypothetical protein
LWIGSLGDDAVDDTTADGSLGLQPPAAGESKQSMKMLRDDENVVSSLFDEPGYPIQDTSTQQLSATYVVVRVLFKVVQLLQHVENASS